MSPQPTPEEVSQERGLTMEQIRALNRTRGLSNEALLRLPAGALRRAVRRLDYPDLPRARESFRLLQEMNEQGYVPAAALVNALRQLDSARLRGAAERRIAGLPVGRRVAARSLSPTAGLNPNHTGWVPLGPGNIGGRTRSIIVHPQNHDTLWAGSVGGGIWRTDDGGTSWLPVDDFMANLAVCCMVIDPTNPDVLFAGTGEGFSNLDAIRGAGIFRTEDGETWSQLGSTTGEHFRAVNRLALSSDGQVLLAATNHGIFHSEERERLVWTHLLSQPIGDVDFHPTDNSQAIAGGLNNGQAYFSTNGGRTWTAATHSEPWSGRVEVAYAVANPTIVYASVESGSGEIWRSTDGGRTYSRRQALTVDGEDANQLGDQGWYDNVIWAGDPTDPDLVIVGGIDLWKSTDGGDTLIDISTWWEPTSVHADHHCIVAHPGYDGLNNRTVFFGNDGGIYKTDDIHTAGNNPDLPRTNGWAELVNGFGVTQFFGGAGNVASGKIIGGAQDNGTLIFTPQNGSEEWKSIFGGDGGYSAADPTDQNVFYGEYVFLNIHRNLDGGTTTDTEGDRYISGQFWNPARDDWDWKPIPFRIPDAKNRQALFIAPFVLDPNEPNRILGGGLSLWRTNDARTPNTETTGPTWRAIKPGVGQRISAITVAQGDSDLIWVGHEKGDVYKAVNGTSTTPVWQKISQAGPDGLTPRRFCTRITVDPGNHQVVYVTFGGYERGNVWKTVDGGLRWSNIGGSLPEAPIRSLAIHPRNSQFLYIGTEVGVFASENGGATWSPTNEGPTNCSVDELFWMGETLVCATHGRGMFQIDLSGV